MRTSFPEFHAVARALAKLQGVEKEKRETERDRDDLKRTIAELERQIEAERKQAETEVKKSKFVAIAAPVDSPSRAMAFVESNGDPKASHKSDPAGRRKSWQGKASEEQIYGRDPTVPDGAEMTEERLRAEMTLMKKYAEDKELNLTHTFQVAPRRARRRVTACCFTCSSAGCPSESRRSLPPRRRAVRTRPSARRAPPGNRLASSPSLASRRRWACFSTSTT